MEKIRTAVIGTGELGTHLGSEVTASSNAELVAISDVNPDTLETAGERLDVDVSRRYSDHESMFAGADLDAVIIATPPVFHHEQIVEAFDHDIDVLCEKPLVIDLEKARDVQRRVERNGQLLMVGYQRHISPAFVHVRNQLRSNTPSFVTAEISEDWIQKYDETWRVDPALSGGGFFLDTGSHLLDAILWMTELEPTSVRASMTFLDEDDWIDVRGQITIECSGNEMISLSLPGDVDRLSEFVQIWDEFGSLRIDGRYWEQYEVTRIDQAGSEHAPEIDEFDDGHASKVSAFLQAVTTRSRPPATVSDALKATAVRDAAYESARSRDGGAVDVDL